MAEKCNSTWAICYEVCDLWGWRKLHYYTGTRPRDFNGGGAILQKWDMQGEGEGGGIRPHNVETECDNRCSTSSSLAGARCQMGVLLCVTGAWRWPLVQQQSARYNASRRAGKHLRRRRYSIHACGADETLANHLRRTNEVLSCYVNQSIYPLSCIQCLSTGRGGSGGGRRGEFFSFYF